MNIKGYTMNITFLEETLDYNWDMDPLDRSIDPIKTHKYLSSLEDDRDYNFVKDIIANTTYINFEKFKNSLIDSFEKFKRYIGDKPFYILLPFKPIGTLPVQLEELRVQCSDPNYQIKLLGSEHWLTVLLLSLIHI